MRGSCLTLFVALVFLSPVSATVVPRLSLQALVDQSEFVVQGNVTRTWVSWDAGHQFIWTHHEIQVTDSLKGRPQSTMIVSEPGGTLDGVTLRIPGAVRFQNGEQVILFLYRTPIGYLRPYGYGQGKYTILHGRVHLNLEGVDLVDIGASQASTPPLNLDGTAVSVFRGRIRSLVQHAARRIR